MSNILWIDGGDRKVKYCFTIFNKEIANIYFTVIVPTSADKNIDIIACTWPRNKLNIIFIAPWTHNTAFIISYFLIFKTLTLKAEWTTGENFALLFFDNLHRMPTALSH